MTASQELCAELYGVSWWTNTGLYTHKYRGGTFDKETLSRHPHSPEMLVPLYDLSYLLRKLPVWVNGMTLRLSPNFTDKDGWICGYGVEGLTSADTPEDAVCKLAIELFKQGILHGN